jgi:hypothetical protein
MLIVDLWRRMDGQGDGVCVPFVVPAKAGSHQSRPEIAEKWVPAFAGTTDMRSAQTRGYGAPAWAAGNLAVLRTRAGDAEMRIDQVTVTKVAELEVTGGSRFILPQATYEEILPIRWLQPHFPDERSRLKMIILAIVAKSGAESWLAQFGDPE